MASGTQLKMQFDTLSGSKTWTYNYAKSSATVTQVKALGASMIANGEIYTTPPLVLKSAKLVVTTEQEYDLES